MSCLTKEKIGCIRGVLKCFLNNELRPLIESPDSICYVDNFSIRT